MIPFSFQIPQTEEKCIEVCFHRLAAAAFAAKVFIFIPLLMRSRVKPLEELTEVRMSRVGQARSAAAAAADLSSPARRPHRR